ncbi:hypothetical protein GO485_03575 [Pseudoduganella flava]|uniref:Uncharacterized protein n=1 Tax=Pseudoduganella flava TaxID=871742 RepID=A0ABX6FKX1_9BURK|nr:hypothetical protein GO485_03575 [Pseudoduganella flava]
MKGDFTRDTFDRSRHYSRVLMQQGRVQLDADWNEQGALMLHQLRSLAMDLVGPAWAVGNGFQLTIGDNDFTIGPGRFYVDGIACDLVEDLSFLAQPGVREADRNWNTDTPYLVYIDAWERLVTAAEDERLREVALGGADTAARAQVVWQVRLLPVPPDATGAGRVIACSDARVRLREDLLRTLPVLYAWAVDDAADAPCEISPDSSYRGRRTSCTGWRSTIRVRWTRPAMRRRSNGRATTARSCSPCWRLPGRPSRWPTWAATSAAA